MYSSCEWVDLNYPIKENLFSSTNVRTLVLSQRFTIEYSMFSKSLLDVLYKS